MLDWMEERAAEAWKDEYEEGCERQKIEDGCCECGDIPDYKFQGECFCRECLDDLLNQKFNEDYSVCDKAEILGVEVRMI